MASCEACGGQRQLGQFFYYFVPDVSGYAICANVVKFGYHILKVLIIILFLWRFANS